MNVNRPDASGRRVLVTGASSGLGRATALGLVRAGARVVATTRAAADAGRLRAEAGPALATVPLDVLDEGSVRAAFTAAVNLVGGLDVVVANAGVELSGPLETASDADVRWLLDTNVLGTIRVARAAVPVLRAGIDARLVLVSSVVGFAARPGLAVYSASKFAVSGLAEALWWELAPWGIAVSAVEPGRFPTALGANRRTGPAGGYDAHLHRFGETVGALEPPGYAPEPGAVADAVLALVTGPAPPLHNPVGTDAERIAGLLGRASFEDFAARLGAAARRGEEETPA